MRLASQSLAKLGPPADCANAWPPCCTIQDVAASVSRHWRPTSPPAEHPRSQQVNQVRGSSGWLVPGCGLPVTSASVRLRTTVARDYMINALDQSKLSSVRTASVSKRWRYHGFISFAMLRLDKCREDGSFTQSTGQRFETLVTPPRSDNKGNSRAAQAPFAGPASTPVRTLLCGLTYGLQHKDGSDGQKRR